MRRVFCGVTVALVVSVSAGFSGTGTADLLLVPSPGYPGQMRYGSAGFALHRGPAALEGNPSALGSGFSASGGRWNLETTSVSAVGAFSISPSIIAGAGVRYIGKSGLVERDAEGNETGEFSFSTGSLNAGISYDVFGGWKAGISLGVAWERIAGKGGTGMVASAGLSGSPFEGAFAGASLRGIGQAPSWNGIRKNMPTEVTAALLYNISSVVSVFGGGRIGFSTFDSYCAGVEFDYEGFTASGGWEVAPGEDETSGLFAGMGYSYVSEQTYLLELAVSQRHELEWPVLAGLSVLF